MAIKVNLNLVLVLAVAIVVSVPIVYALVEPSIIINMDAGQTTKPLQIKDSVGTEVFSVDTTGTIFPSVGSGTSKMMVGSISEFTTFSAGSTQFHLPFQSSSGYNISSDSGMVVPINVTATVLAFGSDTNTMSVPLIITLQVNQIDTSLVLSVPAGNVNGTTTGSVSITEGDKVRFKMNSTAGAGSVDDNFSITLILEG